MLVSIFGATVCAFGVPQDKYTETVLHVSNTTTLHIERHYRQHFWRRGMRVRRAATETHLTGKKFASLVSKTPILGVSRGKVSFGYWMDDGRGLLPLADRKVRHCRQIQVQIISREKRVTAWATAVEQTSR